MPGCDARRQGRPFRVLALSLIVGVTASGVALAQSGRPDTRSMTCKQAQALVEKSGSIVMSTGTTTFEKFVSNGSYCVPQTRQVRALFAPTRDDPKCPVGYRCFQNRRVR